MATVIHLHRARPSESSGRLWRSWTAWCAAGETIGIGTAAAIAATALVANPAGLGGKIVALAAITMGGAVEGLAVGSFQWRVLRRRFPSVGAGSWIGVTVAVAALFWLLGSLAPVMFLGDAGNGGGQAAEGPPFWLQAILGGFAGIVAGAAFGAAQWIVLRRHVAAAGRWIWANALGWAVALFWIFGAASLPTVTTPAAVKIVLGCAAGVLAGLSVGAVTGRTFVRLQWRPVRGVSGVKSARPDVHAAG